MADRIPVKARFAQGSPVDVVALQEFEPSDTIPLSIISGFAAGVTTELGNNSIGVLGDVDIPTPANNEVLTFNSTSGNWEASISPGSSFAVWGNITGTLSDQLDLQSALDLKADQTSLDTHTGDATIHFTEATIDHLNILSVGTNTHAQIDTHISDTTIHFTEVSIDHLNILNVGTNTHAQIDTHISDTTIHFTEVSIDHLNILNVGTLTHAQIDSHINNTGMPHSATDILFDDTVVGGGFTEVQSVLDFFDDQIGLRETAATGVISGGDVTMDTATTINIAPGAGEIVDGYTDRKNPTRTNVNWAAVNGFVVTMTGALGIQVIYVDSSGTVLQQSGGLSPQQRRTTIQLAFIFYHNGVIETVHHAGIHSNEVGNTLYDWLAFTETEQRIKGMGINPVTGQLAVWASAGQLLSPGINIDNDIIDPNILDYVGVGDVNTPLIFDVVLQDGTIAEFPPGTPLTNQTVIPDIYEDPLGTVVQITGNDACIQYLYRTISNEFILQIGQTLYNTAARARDSLEVDRTTYQNFINSETTVVSAQIYRNVGATNFNNSNTAGIVSLIGDGAGASGGIAVSDYLSLSDVIDNSYVGKVGTVPTVNATETGLELLPPAAGGSDELVKVSAADTTAGYLANELVAGTSIDLTVLNPGADETLEVKFNRQGFPYIATIGGNEMAVYDDTTRAKTLSTETEVLYFAESLVSDSDWMQIQHATDADSGYVMPFNGTIVSVAMHCENTNGIGKILDYYINLTNMGAIGQFTGLVNEQITNTSLNLDFAAGDKIRLRGSPTPTGNIQDTNIQIRVKWRL